MDIHENMQTAHVYLRTLADVHNQRSCIPNIHEYSWAGYPWILMDESSWQVMDINEYPRRVLVDVCGHYPRYPQQPLRFMDENPRIYVDEHP